MRYTYFPKQELKFSHPKNKKIKKQKNTKVKKSKKN